MHPPHRRLTLVLGTTALLVVGLLGGAAPAQAAAGSYEVHLTGRTIDGFAQTSLRRASGAAGDTLKVRMEFESTGAKHRPSPLVYLERRIGAGWHRVVRAQPRNGDDIVAVLPAYTVPADVAKQYVEYRFTSERSRARGIRNTAHSDTFVVTYENPAFYSGLAKHFYAYSSLYCPTVAVHQSFRVGYSRGAAAYYQWSQGITVDPSVEDYPADDLEAVALHECAHFHQFFDYGNNRVGDLAAEKASKRVFVNDDAPAGEVTARRPEGRFDPYEHAADCASHAVQPAGYLGYGGYCNPTELAAGLTLIQGGRY